MKELVQVHVALSVTFIRFYIQTASALDVVPSDGVQLRSNVLWGFLVPAPGNTGIFLPVVMAKSCRFVCLFPVY